MSRYIETEYIGRTINHLPTRYVQAERDETAMDIVISKIDVVKAIASAPSIDIIRCKDCKHREEYPCKVYHDDDWYCADGEREGE